MNKEINLQYIESMRKPMFIFGIILAGLGGLILIYLGILVIQVINNPEEVRIVELILAQVKMDGAVIFGMLGEHKIDINVSEPVRLILFLFIGVLILSALSKIVHILISSGISIIQFATIEKRDHIDK